MHETIKNKAKKEVMATPTASQAAQSMVNAREMLRLEMLTSFEKYTKAMFKAQYHRSFLVAKHHKMIFDALQDVVDGKIKRLMINIAPRYGKCHALTDEVFTTKGLKQVKDIEPGEYVYSFRNGKAVINKVLATEPAFKDSYKITMRSGRTITASYDHPILTVFGYKQLQDLKIGDKIQALRARLNSKYEIDDNELLLTTLMIFEGNCSQSSYRFATTDPLILREISKVCKALGIPLKHYDCCRNFEYNLLGSKAGKIGQLMQKYGLDGHLAYTKRLPRDWFNLSMRQKYMFVGMMVATDGCIDQRSGQIVICLANEGLIQDIQHLLSTMGVISMYVYKQTGIGTDAWHLAIPRQYAQKLYPYLNFYGKAEAARAILTKDAKSNLDTFPYDIIRAEKMTGVTSKPPYRCQSNKAITRDKFERLASVFPQLQKYVCEDFYLDEVADIEWVGTQELKHLEVDNDHNFIVNGIVSHNTELVIKSFISWCFALNPKCRFLHLSYSDTLVEDNSDTIRTIMQTDLYRDLFPSSQLANEKGSKKRWKTKAGGELYATPTQGQVTGFGAGAVDIDPTIDIMDGGNSVFTFDDHTNEMLSMIGAQSNIFQGAIVIDDPIKPEDAESEVVRERVNTRFESTIRNRTNSRNTPIIIIMQRLHEHDLCGYLQEAEPDEWTVLSLPVIQRDEEGQEYALWPQKHTLQELYKLRELNTLIFDTQYMQDPTPREGLMYAGFKTYTPEQLPAGHNALQKWCYTDTADTGADFFCSICFINTPEYVYVTDVLFTDAPMEVTEPKQAEMLTINGTVDCLIESNNGGSGFSRNVKRILRTSMRNFKCAINIFHQSANKATRIFTASAQVQNDILFPVGWEKKWPKFYQAITSYRKDNKKKGQHDDAPDCLTGVWEMHSRKTRRKKIKARN